MIYLIDLEVLDYLSEFKVAKTDALTRLFYKNKKYAQRRLLGLYKEKEVDRTRDHISQQYRYWIKGSKPQQMKHSLLLTDFHAKLSELVEVTTMKPAFKIYNLIPDGFVVYKYRNMYYSNFIEVQLSPSRKTDTEKYKHLLHSNVWRKQFNGVFPRVIFISNRKIEKPSEYKLIQIKEDLSDIEKIFK